MANSIASTTAARQSSSVDRDRSERSTDVDQYFEDLKAAMDDTGWTPDALAALWQCHRSHVYRILAQEKRMGADDVCALPDELEAAFEARRAKRRGFIVVKPIEGLAAKEAIIAGVAGLLGLMSAPALPERSSGQLKVELSATKRKVVA